MVSIVLGCSGKLLPKKVAYVEESHSVMETRFQDPLQVLGLLGHNWNTNITNFQASKQIIYGRKSKACIHTLAFPIYEMG